MESFRSFKLRGMTEHGPAVFDCTPDNTELYLHHPQFEDVDHIFHRIDDSDRRLGAFVWRHVLGEDVFEEHANMMTGSLNWVVHYRPEPTETDMTQFTRDFMDIPDEVPDEWE